MRQTDLGTVAVIACPWSDRQRIVELGCRLARTFEISKEHARIRAGLEHHDENFIAGFRNNSCSDGFDLVRIAVLAGVFNLDENNLAAEIVFRRRQRHGRGNINRGAAGDRRRINWLKHRRAIRSNRLRELRAIQRCELSVRRIR